MKDIYCDFVDLDSDESFDLFGKSLGGILQNKRLHFDNEVAKGELIKTNPDKGLWIRKWKFMSNKTIVLHKSPSLEVNEKKFVLSYHLNPASFWLNTNQKKLKVNGSRNNLFIPGDVSMHFNVFPKQSFFLWEITLTRSGFSEQFHDAAPIFRNTFNDYANRQTGTIIMLPCSAEEYKILYQLEFSLSQANEDALYIRSRVYNLIFCFLCKIIDRKQSKESLSTIHYEQIMQVEAIIRENTKELPKLETIAKKIGMSVSSLLRHFKFLYGKSIYEYYIESKMELAKEMILKDNRTVKEIARELGYNQASAFIESFTKRQGYSPGSLRNGCNRSFGSVE